MVKVVLTRKTMWDAAASIAMKFVQNPTARHKMAKPDPIRPIPTIVGAWYRSPREPEKNDPTECQMKSFRYSDMIYVHTIYVQYLVRQWYGVDNYLHRKAWMYCPSETWDEDRLQHLGFEPNLPQRHFQRIGLGIMRRIPENQWRKELQ